MKKNVFIVILIIIILGLGGYLVYDKVLSKEEKKETTDEKVVKEEKKDEEKEDTFIGFDSLKSLNTKDYHYSLMSNTNGLYVDYKSDANGSMKLYISYSKDFVAGFGLDTSNIKDMNEVELTTDKRIADIYIGGFGQEISRITILILMEDGTVEYIPVLYALKNNDIKIYGQLQNVEEVVKFLSVNASISDGGSGWITTLAQKADGTFYDLNEVLPKEYYTFY